MPTIAYDSVRKIVEKNKRSKCLCYYTTVVSALCRKTAYKGAIETKMKRTVIFSIATLAMASLAGAQGMNMKSRYAGPVYTGKPMLKVTASLVAAGGGPANFSTAKAVTAIAGADLTNKELAKLTQQYGKEKVDQWVEVGDFAVADALKVATAAGVKLPKANLTPKKLGPELVKMGIDKKTNTYYVEYMLDKLLSHGIHDKVMDDIDAKFGEAADASYHKISNQAYFDLAQAMGMKKVKLADFH